MFSFTAVVSAFWNSMGLGVFMAKLVSFPSDPQQVMQKETKSGGVFIVAQLLKNLHFSAVLGSKMRLKEPLRELKVCFSVPLVSITH